jgi:predicted dehydrogenase
MISKMNRRKFIKRSSLALSGAFAFPTIVPSSVFAAPGRVAPNDRITLGCIGVGGMGTGNLEGFLEKSEVQVLAVCDVDRAHRERAKELVDTKYDNKQCATYNDFRELLARDDIDVIMTATPDHWHAIIAIEIAKTGRDIYAEKPLAFNISEGRAIVDAVQRYGIVWQTGSWQRSEQQFRFACELVRNGRIGKIHTVRVGLPQGNNIQNRGTEPIDPPPGFDYEMWLGPAPWRPYNPSRCHWNFRWISDYSQGQLTDWAGHHCDIANWGMDTELSAPVSIEGNALYPPAHDGLFDTAESYFFVCEFREGFQMIVADSMQQPKGMGVHFIGDDGWIHVNRRGIDAHPSSLLSDRRIPDEIHLYKSDDHIQNFLDCVRSREKTITPVEVAHYSVIVGHLGHIAMKTGRKLFWDLEKEQFINDPDANRLLFRPMLSPWHL